MPGGKEHETYSETHGYQTELTSKGRQETADLGRRNAKETAKHLAGLAGIGVVLGGLSLANAESKKNRKQNDK